MEKQANKKKNFLGGKNLHFFQAYYSVSNSQNPPIRIVAKFVKLKRLATTAAK